MTLGMQDKKGASQRRSQDRKEIRKLREMSKKIEIRVNDRERLSDYFNTNVKIFS